MVTGDGVTRAEEHGDGAGGRCGGIRWCGRPCALVGAVVAAASLVNVAEVFFVRSTLHSTAGMYGLMESVWVSASVAGGWWVARRRPSDAGLARLLLGSLALTCLGVALVATVPAVAWLAPVGLLGGAGNGGVNVAARVLLGRRVPAAMRGQAFAVFGAVANGASVAGLLLGGVLLGVLPVRVTIAAAGLGGLAATAGFALPVLRAMARERDTVRQPHRVCGPGRATGDDRGNRVDQRERDDRADGTGQVSAGRRAGAAEPARPLR